MSPERNITRILVVTKNRLIISKIRSATENVDVIFDFVASIYDVMILLMKQKYNGVIFDSDILSKTHVDDRPVVQRYREILSFARVTYSQSTLDVIIHEDTGNDFTLDNFIKKCSRETPRQFRCNERKELNLSVNITNSLRAKKVTKQKTRTLNLSQSGCLIESNIPMRVGSKVYITFNIFKDKTPIECKIIWTMRNKKVIKGYGLHFENMSSQQQQEIFHYICFMGEKARFYPGLSYYYF